MEVPHEASAARTIAEAQSKAQVIPACNGSGYLNEVSSLTVHSKSGDTEASDARTLRVGVENREH